MHWILSTTVQSVGFLSAALVVWFIWDRYYRFKDLNLPPGPQRFPIIGNIPQMLSQPFLVLDEFHKKVGRPGVISLQLGESYAVMICDHEGQQEAQLHGALSGRPPASVVSAAAPEINVYTSVESGYLKRRAALSTHLLENMELLRSQAKIYDRESRAIVENIRQEMQKSDPGVGINPVAILQSGMLNQVASLTLGLRWEFTSVEFKLLKEINHSVAYGLARGSPRDYLSWAPVGSNFELVEQAAKRRDAVLRPLFQDAVDSFDAAREPRHFVDQCLKEQHSARESGDTRRAEMFNNEKIYGLFVGDILIGAGETVPYALWWTFGYLVRNPKWIQRAYDEVTEFCARFQAKSGDSDAESGTAPTEIENPLNAKHWAEWSVINAIVNETLRMRPPAAIAIPRLTAEPVKIRGYTIPRGTQVMCNQYSLGHDERVWPEHNRWNPARFLNEGTNVSDSKLLDAPFSFGKQRCPGKNTAKVSLSVYLANILRNFDILFPEGADTNDEVYSDAYDPQLSIAPKPLCTMFRFIPRS